MDKVELSRRTKDFALLVLKLVDALPKGTEARAIGSQLVRSGTSVGANYRSSLRGRSRAEWLSKMNICLEEADESIYWLELIIEAALLPRTRVEPLHHEATEITAIFAAAIKTARAAGDQPRSAQKS